MSKYFVILLFFFAMWARAADPLATAVAEYRALDEVYTADGTVEAVRQSTVAAQISGRIVEIRFDVGDRVNKGEAIVRIDEREVSDALATTRAQLAQAQATLTNAKASYERTQQLYHQKFVSQAALDKVYSEYRAAQAQYEAAAAVASQAATVRSFATVTAPYSGVVSARHVELGETVTPGKPLMTGFDPNELRVVADIPQFRMTRIDAKSTAIVEFPALNERIKASAITVLPAADPRTHTTRVRLSLPQYVKGTYPGMYARVKFSVGQARKLVIPAGAVVRRTEVTGAYVVSDKGEVQFRQIRLGESSNGAGVEVLAGLQAGEKVALDPVKAAIAMRRANAQP